MACLRFQLFMSVVLRENENLTDKVYVIIINFIFIRLFQGEETKQTSSSSSSRCLNGPCFKFKVEYLVFLVSSVLQIFQALQVKFVISKQP